MKIIDCFPYYNERELLELRIRLLYDVVDKFVITDANMRHTGIAKDWTCAQVIAELGLPTDKIEVVNLLLSSKAILDQNWVRENQQRDAAAKFITDDTVAIISDCDEIMDPTFVKYYAQVARANPGWVLRIPMHYLNCRADLRVVDGDGRDRDWSPAFMCLPSHLEKHKLSQIREAYTHGKPESISFRSTFATDNGVIQKAGWHFSWMGNSAKQKLKFNSIADRHDVIPGADVDVDGHIDEYRAAPGTTDPLGRPDHILQPFNLALLPKKIRELPAVHEYLLPNERKDVILMHDNFLGMRGTSVALYDYAIGCRKYFGLNPIIVHKAGEENDAGVLEKFRAEFPVISYHALDELQAISDRVKAKYFYAIKYGTYDGVVVRGPRNLIHSVFSTNPLELHGDRYAVVSESQSAKNGWRLPFVPHMVNLPEHDFYKRKELGIPDDAVVVGRYGGNDTFNIQFAKDEVLKAAQNRDDIWFIFANTDKFCDHPRVLFLDPITDPDAKVTFINTCDAMLHARDYGETFGLAVLEFASLNKKVIVYGDKAGTSIVHPLGGTHHLDMLGDDCYRYDNAEELAKILRSIARETSYWNTEWLRDKFGPREVMNKFREVFLD